MLYDLSSHIFFLFISIGCFGQNSNSFSDHVEKNKYLKQNIENTDVHHTFDNQEISHEPISIMNERNSKNIAAPVVYNGRNGKKNKAIYITLGIVVLAASVYTLTKAL